MHGEMVIIEVQQRGRGIEDNVPASGSIVERSEAVGPRIEEWDSRGAALGFGGFKIINAAKKFGAAMP
jgi:hypothetical protein